MEVCTALSVAFGIIQIWKAKELKNNESQSHGLLPEAWCQRRRFLRRERAQTEGWLHQWTHRNTFPGRRGSFLSCTACARNISPCGAECLRAVHHGCSGRVWSTALPIPAFMLGWGGGPPSTATTTLVLAKYRKSRKKKKKSISLLSVLTMFQTAQGSSLAVSPVPTEG